MDKLWYHVCVCLGDELTEYTCQFDDDIRSSVFAKDPDDFIKLNNVYWQEKNESGKKTLIKLNEYQHAYGDHMYVPRKIMQAIYPAENINI